MEIATKHLMTSFLLSILLSVVLIIFVFQIAIIILFSVITILMLGLSLFLGFIMVFYQMSYAKYPATVWIYQRRAGNMHVIVPDRAKRISSGEAGKYAFYLKGLKLKTKPIDFKYIYTGAKGGSFVNLYMVQSGELNPITLEEADVLNAKLVVISENSKYWYSEQLRRNYERWAKKFGFEKYALFIQYAATGFIIAFLLYIFLGQMQGVIAQMGGITDAQAKLIEQVSNLLQRTGTITAPAPQPVI